MGIVNILRKIYKKFVHLPLLDKIIYKVLDFMTSILELTYRFSFPRYYSRRQKLDMLWELYEKETVDLFKNTIKPGMTIIDIGAHIGYFTRLFSKLTGAKGNVYGLEADPDNFQLLKQNTAHLKNICISQLAITEKAGKASFYQSSKSGCHSIIPADFREKKITVQSMDLDNFIEKENISQVDAIKMDIEGGELKAILGMKQTLLQNPRIKLVLEFNPPCLKLARVDPCEFLKVLEQLGFVVYTINESGLNPIEVKNPETYERILKLNDINLYCTKKHYG